MTDLFSYPHYNGTPPHSNPTTSLEAAEAIRPSAGSLRAKVLAYLTLYPHSTDEDIQLGLGMDGNTQRPRRRELEQMGKIRESGIKRLKSGRNAKTWEVP
jgi:hypothetical protein